MTMADEIENLQLSFETLRGTEHAKNQLIQDLLKRLRILSQELEQEKLDHDRESHFNREVQLHVKELKDELRLIKTRIVSKVDFHMLSDSPLTSARTGMPLFLSLLTATV